VIKHTIHKKKLQLWTNADKTEYAIYLTSNSDNKSSNKNIHRHSNDELVINTNRDGNLPYTQLLEESDYLEDLRYDWKYTLEQWIDNERNKHIITTAGLPPSLPDENFVTQNRICDADSNYQPKQDADKEKRENSAMDKIAIYNNLRKYKVRRKNKNKKKIKCHFCKLEYLTNRDRTEHELAWHPNKSNGNSQLALSLYDIKNGNANSLTNAPSIK
jgi:hypothetical protein